MQSSIKYKHSLPVRCIQTEISQTCLYTWPDAVVEGIIIDCPALLSTVVLLSVALMRYWLGTITCCDWPLGLRDLSACFSKATFVPTVCFGLDLMFILPSWGTTVPPTLPITSWVLPTVLNIGTATPPCEAFCPPLALVSMFVTTKRRFFNMLSGISEVASML